MVGAGSTFWLCKESMALSFHLCMGSIFEKHHP